MREILSIDRRFNGPPDSANGGYVCGLVAARLPGATTEVTLRAPPPLERDLVLDTKAGRATLHSGTQLFAEAQPAELDLHVPSAVPPADAERAAERYAGFHRHVFPTCFVCGPLREEEDGLRIFAGSVDDRGDTVAAPWTPGSALAEDSGAVRSEFVWAALDCPGAFAIGLEGGRVLVLGRLTARLAGEVRAGEPHVVLAWPIGAQGRKHFAGSAIFGPSGQLCASARAVWIDIGASPKTAT